MIGKVRTRDGTFCGIGAVGEISPVAYERIERDAYQTEHSLLRELLRKFLVAEVEPSRDEGGCDQVMCGAVAALDSLLAAHPVDRRGRCRSCRGPGWPGHRRQVCMVYRKAHFWLRQLTEVVFFHLVREMVPDGD